jgi:hypothetical protein
MEIKPILLVTWEDAWATQGYYYSNNDHTALLCQSVGFEMEYTDESLVLSQSITEDNEDRGRNILIIPTKYIVSVEELIL